MEIPIEENPDNLEEWSDPNIDLNNPENNPWFENETNEKEISELFIGDLFIVLLKDYEKPFLCKVETINEEDKSIDLSNKDNKHFIFSYDDYNNLLLITENYEALEIIRVKEIEDIDGYKEEVKEVNFETEIKEEFEKEYSEDIQKDDLLNILIQIYDCYGNDHKIEKLYNIIEIYGELINNLKIEKKEKIIQNYFIPIFGNDIKIHLDSGTEEIKNLLNIADTDYINTVKNIINNSSPFIYKEGIGYLLENYENDTLKDCSLNSTCSGLNGDYDYDERRLRKSLKIPRDILNNKNEYQTEIFEIISPEKLLITGILEQPFDKYIYNFKPDIFDSFTLYEKINIDNYWTKLNLFYRQKFKDITIIYNLAEINSIKPDINDFISHNFNEIINEENLKKIIDTNLKNEKDIINLLLESEYKEYLLNNKNIQNILCKYSIDFKNLSDISHKKIKTLISDNIKEYIENYNKTNKKKFKFKKFRKKPLTDKRRVELVYDYIFTLLSEKKRNELLKEFISKFTRSPNKKTENPNYLYNKYTDKKILCKHYLYSTEIDNSNNIFSTLKTKFGLPPKDGYIHCKVCGEYICHEDFSSLEGFSDDVPIQSNEIMVSQDKENLLNKIEEKLEKKSELAHYIKIIASMIGIELINEDIYKILLSYDYLDHNVLADKRYKLTGVTDTDIHPKLKQLLKENKEKEKKEKDPNKKEKIKKKKNKIISNFQDWIKNTNKLFILISLVSLFIQTAIPVYNIRRNINFKILETDEKINDNTINFITEKFKKICEKYNSDILIKDIIEIINKSDIESFEEQLKRTINYCNTPLFNILLERKENYKKYIKSEKKQYLKQEWTTFKPLAKNKLVILINDFLTTQKNDKYLKKLYGGFLIENISVIRPIEEINNISLSQKLSLPIINILQNSTFQKLFRYIISCYGKHKSNTLINLFFQNLLDTNDKSEQLKNIMVNNGWRSDTQSFPNLSFKILR